MEWAQQTRPTYPQKPVGKYLAKFPMCRKIITDAGHIWAYNFNERGIVWTYECSVLMEINKQK